MSTPPGFPELLTPREVARMFGVHPTTVSKWARSGRLRSVRTGGGHRRYFRDQVEAIISGSPA